MSNPEEYYKSRVFVTSEDPRLDFTPALAFGHSVVGVFPPGQVHLHPQVALYQARKILRDMTKDDYLALVGDPVKIAICTVVAMEIIGRVKMLRWNRQSLSYVEVPVDFLDRQVPQDFLLQEETRNPTF